MLRSSWRINEHCFAWYPAVGFCRAQLRSTNRPSPRFSELGRNGRSLGVPWICLSSLVRSFALIPGGRLLWQCSQPSSLNIRKNPKPPPLMSMNSGRIHCSMMEVTLSRAVACLQTQCRGSKKGDHCKMVDLRVSL